MSAIPFCHHINGIEKQKSQSVKQLNVKGTVPSKSVAAMWREALIVVTVFFLIPV